MRSARIPCVVVCSTVVRATLLLTVLTVVGAGAIRPSQLSTAPAAVPALPDTTNNIHLGLTFNYNVSNPLAELGVADFVWGSQYPTQPASVYNTYYAPFDREQDGSSHNLTWFKANHPDWIEYQCDRTTVAYEFGDANVPLDITNPAVLSYLFQTYYAPAIQQGYQGIAFDNVNLSNSTSVRCGHYDSNDQWVQQFTGGYGDPAYHSAILNWAQWMYTQIHGINGSVTMNFSYDSDDPADSTALYQYMDVDTDERGFTNWGNAGSNYLAGSAWLPNMQALAALDGQGKGFLSINQEPESFGNITQAEKQWILANYLLVKGRHSWVFMCGEQQYGSILVTPEYSAQIGSATNSMYQAQNVYMRDFTNGKAIVNPSTSQSYAITLPQNTYKDLYGNAVNSLTLQPESGIVLLGSTNTSQPTAIATPLLVTATPLTVLSGNGLNVPKGMAVVGSQVWVANNGTNTISRFNTDGTAAGSPLSGNGLSSPYGVAVVGSQVWVANNGTNTISRFNTDGTSAGSALKGNGLSTPKGLVVVGTQVWVSNHGNSTLSRFNFDGTSAGSALSGNGLDQPRGGAVVNSQVWIPNYNNSTISVFNTDGTSASSPIAGNGLNGPEGAAVIGGTQVWLPNYSGNSVSLFNLDGSAASTPLTGNGLSNPHAVAQVGTQVWVANAGNDTISRWQL